MLIFTWHSFNCFRFWWSHC